MAKIIISIEDMEGGKVSVTSDPSFETMVKKLNSGNKLTSADGYAIAALNHVRNKSKEMGPLGVTIPRVKGN